MNCSDEITIPREFFKTIAELSIRLNKQAKERLRIETEVPPFSVYKGGKLIKMGGVR